MTILQINNNHYLKGGTESVYLNTIELLKRKNHKIISFALDSDKNFDSAQKRYFLYKKKYIHNRFYSLESIRQIKKLLDTETPDIVHIHNIIGGITYSILPIIKKKGIPIVASIHDFRLLCPAYVFINGKSEICEECKTGKYYNCILNNCSPEGYVRSFMLSAESYLRDFFIPYYKVIDQFIFVSRFTQNKFLEFNPNLKSVSNQLYNFTNEFEKSDKRGEYFLYFGRLSREKGLITLIQAFSKLPDVKLKIVGDGDLRVELEKMKSPNVELLGYKSGDELKNIIKNSSFVIVPSECYETLSMTTVESFSFGKPVIGSNLGALLELIENRNRGFLLNNKDIDSIVDVVSYANSISDENYYIMSLNAFEFATQNFSSDNYYHNLIAIYRKVIDCAQRR